MKAGFPEGMFQSKYLKSQEPVRWVKGYTLDTTQYHFAISYLVKIVHVLSLLKEVIFLTLSQNSFLDIHIQIHIQIHSHI